ncbi:hypothetical protein D9M68_568260 [compost metagenome]
MNATKIQKLLLIVFLSLSSINLYAQDTLQVNRVEAILYTGVGGNQLLVVGLGGSEGGNAWASNYWKKTRDEFIAKGYAFLAIGYFGSKGTPKILDKIAIDDVYQAIATAKKYPKINAEKIALIGGSRGADLALLLGSYYQDISCVIAMSASHAVFPGHTQEFTSSCWTYQGKELPFIPVNEAAVPFLMKGDLRGTFEAMLQDTVAEKKSLISVARINGPILLLSGKKDEIIPATAMAEKMMSNLKRHQFKYAYQHITYEGSHAEPTKHFDVVFDFLAKNFLSK